MQDSLLNTTLNLSIRVTHQSGDHIFRTRQLDAEADDSVSTEDGAGGNSMPQLQSLPSMSRASAFGIPTSSRSAIVPPSGSAPGALMLGASYAPAAYPTNDREGNIAPSQNPSVVLENSIPNPELVQRRVYEQMFQEQVRDAWPQYIVASRVDATQTVDALYARICAQDGIGVAGGAEAGDHLDRVEKMMSVDALIESRDGVRGNVAGANTVQKRQSDRSPRLLARSSSLGELPRLRI